MTKVLVVAPGRKTRGGITAVIKAYEQSEVWKKYNCFWIETYIDKSPLLKILYFLKSFATFLVLLPFYNIVHIHFSWTVSAYRKLFFFIYAQLLGKKVIVHLHSGAEPVLQSKAQFVYRYLFKKADVTVFLAEVIKHQIGQTFEIKNPGVIFNPCLVPLNHTKCILVKKEPIILFAGTITEKKGTNDLILAFGKIAKKYPEWKLVLAGNGEIEESKQLTLKLDIPNQVVFTGWVTGVIKNELFNKAEIFCLPSYTEGFPMAVLDAWAFGIPVVTTPVGGLPDVLLHGENSMVFQPGDINELADKLEILIGNPALRNKLSGASLKMSGDLFSMKSISDQTDEMYVSLI